MSAPIPTRIVPSVQPSERTPAQIAREFRRRLEGGARLRPAGEARRNPLRLLSLGYTPKYKIESSSDNWRAKRYRSRRNLLPYLELALGIYFSMTVA